MKLLVIGGGGREHALAAKLRADAPDAAIFIAPGNPGTAQVGTNLDVAVGDLEGLAAFAASDAIDLTVVGPEQPLAAGLADLFVERGLPVFGPIRQAARIESSKAFAKRLMADNGIPTANFEVFTDAEAARAYARAGGGPLVVKASGLAAGKGAIVCDDVSESLAAIDAMMVEGRLGEAGRRIVLEERMEGPELSVFFITDGERAVPLLPSRDHKRLLEGDEGPNTGGMGAYAPVADGTPELIDDVRRTIAQPVLDAMAEQGTPYIGFLYAGLMLTSEGPKVVEFNCRLGDPEAQAVLPITSSNLVEPLRAVARGEGLGDWEAESFESAALVTVLASEGYPGPYEKGREIHIPADLESERIRVFQAGTATEDNRLVTAGGRVLGVTGIGPDIAAAASASRDGAKQIAFEGKQWRSDIGRSEGG